MHINRFATPEIKYIIKPGVAKRFNVSQIHHVSSVVVDFIRLWGVFKNTLLY